MTEQEIEVREEGEGRFIVGDTLVVTRTGVFRLAEEGVPGAKLGNGDVGYAKRLIAAGKV